MESSDIISCIIKQFSKVYNANNPQLSSFVSNNNGTSYYLSQKKEKGEMPVQIRISNHGTYLKTWVDRQHLSESKERMLDPSHCINISVVFIDEGQNITRDCPNQPDCENCLIEPCIPQTFDGQNELGHPFKVFQYCYQSKFIRNKYIKGIVKSIAESISKGEYIDPLKNLYRKAKSNTLQSNTQNTNESKNYKNMKKNVQRINESQLRAIVAESVKRVLKENGYDDNPPSGYEIFSDWGARAAYRQTISPSAQRAWAIAALHFFGESKLSAISISESK